LNILPQVGNYVANFMLMKMKASTIDYSRKIPNTPSMTMRCSAGISHMTNIPSSTTRCSEDV
jgi:hypothetical protein